MFINAAIGSHAEHAELVALCDPSETRMAHWNARIAEATGGELPTYKPEDFDRMVEEARPDCVIVTTIDAEHHRYIIRALELGCDAVTEKPMTIDEDKAQAILDAAEKHPGKVRVTFNYRYMPAMSKIREIVSSGEIGQPTLVDFQWRLDTSHGADYFRRWHREKAKSGGLLVHKATHHFDLVNWILGDAPRTVSAQGGTMFYGKANAEARGESPSYDRYTGEAAAKDDPFALRLDEDDDLKSLYLDAEADSGYVRDRNVFSDKWPLDAEDTMAVIARYRGGAIFNYSLIAYCPWEGLHLTVTGTAGQIELFERGSGHVIRGQNDEQLAAEQQHAEQQLRMQKMFEPSREIEIPTASGGHGGGDAIILDRVFLPEEQLEPDPLGRDANHVDGAASILLGVAANKSIEAGGAAINVDSLLRTSVHDAVTA
jgi:predicted dehydrogenase